MRACTREMMRLAAQLWRPMMLTLQLALLLSVRVTGLGEHENELMKLTELHGGVAREAPRGSRQQEIDMTVVSVHSDRSNTW